MNGFSCTVTRDQLQAYADASGDINPIHLDEKFAKEKAGLPGVIVHGMLSMAFLGELVRKNYPEDKFEIKKIKGRFRKVTFPEDPLTVEGEVKSTDSGVTQLYLSVKNSSGEITTDGTAELIQK